MRYKLLILLIIFNSFILNNIIKAEEDYKVEYYFQDENNEDIYNQSEKDVYYNPKLDEDTYPTFEGYDFKKEEIDNNIYKLYYDIKIITITIDGNGGTINGEESIILKKKYNEKFIYYKDLYNKGYEIKKENYNFLKINNDEFYVKKDITLYIIWKPVEIIYDFIYNAKTYEVIQKYGEQIKFPSIIERDLDNDFICWYIKDNDKSNVLNYSIIEDNFKKKVYALQKKDFLSYNITNNIVFLKNLENIEYSLVKDGDPDNFSSLNYFNIEFNIDYNLSIKIDNEVIYISKLNFKDYDYKIIINNDNLILEPIYNINKVLIDNEELSLDDSNNYTYKINNNKILNIVINESSFNLDLSNINLDEIKTHYFISNLGFLSKPNYIYYKNGEEIEANNLFIEKIEGLNFEYNIENKVYILDKIQYINLNYNSQILDLNNDIDNNYLIKNINNIYEIYSNNEYDKFTNNINYELDYSKEYYIISVSDEGYNYVNYSLKFNDFNIYSYGNKVIINNENNYNIYFEDSFYGSNQNILLENLEKNKLYFFKFNKNSSSLFIYYFYTSEFNDNFDNLEIYTGYNFIKLKNIDFSNEYFLKENTTERYGFGLYNNYLFFDNLNPNTYYDLYVKTPNGNEKLIKENINTSKIPSNKAGLPQKIVVVNEVFDDKIIISCNALYEYSLDNINWKYSDNDILEFNNLDPNTMYIIYVRTKETDFAEASNSIIGFEFLTLYDKPSMDCLINLIYTNNMISFGTKKGYIYYFNNNKINTENFIANNLDNGLKYEIKVERISDNIAEIITINLYPTTYLDSNEKNIEYEKNYNNLIINNSKQIFTYILYDDSYENKIKFKGTGDDISFNNLKNNSYYNLYILKDNDIDLDLYYEEEFISEYYIPCDYYTEIKNSLEDKNLMGENLYNKFIEKYSEDFDSVKNNEEYNLLLQQVIKEVSYIYFWKFFIKILLVMFMFLVVVKIVIKYNKNKILKH